MKIVLMGFPTMVHGNLGLCCTWKKNEVKDFALKEVPFPDDATQQTAWRKSDVKARKILMDSMKNHLISVIAKKETTKERFDSLKTL